MTNTANNTAVSEMRFRLRNGSKIVALSIDRVIRPGNREWQGVVLAEGGHTGHVCWRVYGDDAPEGDVVELDADVGEYDMPRRAYVERVASRLASLYPPE